MGTHSSNVVQSEKKLIVSDTKFAMME